MWRNVRYAGYAADVHVKATRSRSAAATAAPKPPDIEALKDRSRRQREGGMAGGSLLTGPSGVSMVSTGRSTLLGG